MAAPERRTVGVFDSGFGGLTVLRALLPRFPGTHFVYLGDTARLPYGAKSQTTIARYAVEAARFLVAEGAEMLVIACNTATALALPEICAAVAPVPVVGVVEPGARAAAKALRAQGGEALVLATAATVASHAYRDACAALGVRVQEMACPLLVPLVEEGWIAHPVTRDVLRIYLDEALAGTGSAPGAVVLGCTHYPLLAAEIATVLEERGVAATVVDAAEATAEAARTLWPAAESDEPATFRCYATDSVEKFARLGSRFLGQELGTVTLLDLGG